LTATSPYRPEIDGLRALAVLAVVLFHLDPSWLPGGFAGVDVFFVLSGYLITGIMLREKAAGTFGFIHFYRRRIARLLPAFLATAGATLLAARFLYFIQDYATAGASFSAAVLSISNFHLLAQGNYFSLSTDAQPFLHYWSLAVEEQFYLLYPPSLILLLRCPPAWPFRGVLVLALGSLLCSIWLIPLRPSWAFYLLPSRAWELCAGGLLALRPFSPPALAERWPAIVQRAFPWAAAAVLAGSFFLLTGHTPFPGLAALPVVLATLVLLVPETRPGFRTDRPVPDSWHHPHQWLSVRPLTALGRVSYSLYLWHWPVFSFVDYSLVYFSQPQRLLLKVGLTVLTALFSYHGIERPCRTWLNRPPLRLPAIPWRLPGPAFLLVAAALGILTPLGFAIRRENYLDASDRPSGGLVFPQARSRQTILLMGDSQASMYGPVLRDLAASRQSRFLLLSVAGEDPLAPGAGQPASPLWEKNLAWVRREKPDLLILTCHWVYKLSADPERLAATLSALRPWAGHIVLLTQPPLLPASALRPALRQGSRAPWRENPTGQFARQAANRAVRLAAGPQVTALDLDPLFSCPDGSILLFDPAGHPLFQDAVHLSQAGTARVRPLLAREIDQAMTEKSGKSLNGSDLEQKPLVNQAP